MSIEMVEKAKSETDLDRKEDIVMETQEEEFVEDEVVILKRKNTYAAKKTVAQGMMDLALITANANQMKFMIQFYKNRDFTFWTVMVLIWLSLIIQVAVGVVLIFKRRFDLKHHQHEHGIRMGNYVIVGVFLVTVINVFIASFSIGNTADPPVAQPATATSK
ncbi:ninjurin-1-like [Nilaparvata lugens]|uniref:ninjurin-1-like n=1 Tax=Nilaparvata lugens TaxID=108931 RepID=UPI00193EA74D|nr:ninjurin-1-like [Nilaparvata lugens]